MHLTQNLEVSLGGGHWEDMTAGWPESWTPALGGSSPLPCLGNVGFPYFSHTRSHLKDTALREECVEIFGKISVTELRYSFYINSTFWHMLPTSTRLATTQEKPRKFPCLLNLPATNLEQWPLPSVSCCLSSSGQVLISPGELPRVRTDSSPTPTQVIPKDQPRFLPGASMWFRGSFALWSLALVYLPLNVQPCSCPNLILWLLQPAGLRPDWRVSILQPLP